VTQPDDNGLNVRPEEISVTEVSDQVLKELSGLFGSRESIESANEISDTEILESHVDSHDDVTPTPPSDDENTVILVDPGASVSEPVVFIDPLISGMSDDAGLLVVIGDELDRVVIVDNDWPDDLFEERQRRSRGRERLKKIKWIKLLSAVIGCVVVAIAILASPIFAIRTVTMEGAVYASPDAIAAVQKTLKGASVFTVNTRQAREILLADPWVSDVRISTRFPGTALVEIAERVPVIWYVGDDQKARIVDARGRVIAVLKGWPTKYLRVDGVGPSLEAGAAADDVYRAAAQLVLALPDELRPLVKSLEVSGGGELAMTLTKGTLVRFGPPNELQDKLVAVVVLLRRQNPSTLAVIDVSTGEPTVQVR
jgi:cell division septal protein FtsQ